MCSHGAADLVLVGTTVDTAHMTLWRFQTLKHTGFAMEPVEFDCQGSARFGASNLKFTFQRQGDLVWHTFAKIWLPGIVGCSGTTGQYVPLTSDSSAIYYTNAIGQYLLQQVKLVIGGTIIDTLYDTYLYMWEELSGKPGKRLGEMIGKYDTQTTRQATSKRSRWLYVPLPFSFTENTGLALPLVSLQFHNVQLEINLASRSKCIVFPNDDASAHTVYIRPDGMLDTDLAGASLYALQDSDIKVLIDSTHVYLDHDERSKFAHGQFEQIITEVQMIAQVAQASGSSVATETSAPIKTDVRLQFNHVVMEYIFGVRSQDHVDSNLHFDFGGYYDNGHNGGTDLVFDPIKDVTVLFNNQQRVQTRPAQYFRLVQPYQHHTCVPRDFIYVWSYAVDPEDAQPTGGANHSRIDNVNLTLNLDARIFSSTSTSADVIVFARNKNQLRFKHGLVSKRFG